MVAEKYGDDLADLYVKWVPPNTIDSYHYELNDDLLVVVYAVEHFEEITWHVTRFFKLNGGWAVSADLATSDLTKVLAELQNIVRIG